MSCLDAMCSSYAQMLGLPMLVPPATVSSPGRGPRRLLSSSCRYVQSQKTLRCPHAMIQVETQVHYRQWTARAASDIGTVAEETLPEDTALLDEDVQMLVKMRSRYNLIRVLEVARRAEHPLAGARLLLLDRPGNIHSVYYKYRVLTDSYYDVFGVLPPLLPEGPLGLLGLGAGTAARILLYFWPSIEIHAWEIDPAVIHVARQYFDLSDLELSDRGDETGKPGSMGKGRLIVHAGDALRVEANVPGGFAGIIVDLFAEGAVIPALQQCTTWQSLKHRLRPGGRIMVNCGGSCVEAEGADRKDGRITMLETVAALATVFPGELQWKSLEGRAGKSMENCIVMTGPLPDFHQWKHLTPESLDFAVRGWKAVTRSDYLQDT